MTYATRLLFTVALHGARDAGLCGLSSYVNNKDGGDCVCATSPRPHTHAPPVIDRERRWRKWKKLRGWKYYEKHKLHARGGNKLPLFNRHGFNDPYAFRPILPITRPITYFFLVFFFYGRAADRKKRFCFSKTHTAEWESPIYPTAPST